MDHRVCLRCTTLFQLGADSSLITQLSAASTFASYGGFFPLSTRKTLSGVPRSELIALSHLLADKASRHGAIRTMGYYPYTGRPARGLPMPRTTSRDICEIEMGFLWSILHFDARAAVKLALLKCWLHWFTKSYVCGRCDLLAQRSSSRPKACQPAAFSSSWARFLSRTTASLKILSWSSTVSIGHGRPTTNTRWMS